MCAYTEMEQIPYPMPCIMPGRLIGSLISKLCGHSQSGRDMMNTAGTGTGH